MKRTFMLLVIVCVCLPLLLVACPFALVAGLAGAGLLGAGGTDSSPFGAGAGVGGPVIAQHALEMASHMHQGPPEQYDVVFDETFPAQALAAWDTVCGHAGCAKALNGNLQCVPFVVMAYGWSGLSLPGVATAIQWWDAYAGTKQPGWIEVPDGSGLPIPGDMVVMSTPLFGGAGHAAIVVDVKVPHGTSEGSVTIAGANEGSPLMTLPLTTGNVLVPWPNYTVMGYVHHIPSLPADLPAGLPNSAYVGMAVEDAQQANIPVRAFVAQINQESSYNPVALSPAGAQGIAQLMPDTARAWGIDPYDPSEAMWAGAQHMAQYQATYGGDYRKALAAYNAGPAAVDSALAQAGSTGRDWTTFLPAET